MDGLDQASKLIQTLEFQALHQGWYSDQWREVSENVYTKRRIQNDLFSDIGEDPPVLEPDEGDASCGSIDPS